jgi:parallel beta-helix repeat protein
VQYGNQQDLIPLLDLLHKYNVGKAAFFVEKRFIDDNEFVISRIKSQGYSVGEWADLDGYGNNTAYAPTIYRGIPLIESEVLSNVHKDRDAIEFYRIALRYHESSVAAFTPKIMEHKIILEDILKQNGNGIVFVDEPAKGANAGDAQPATAGTEMPQLRLNEGTWTIKSISEKYPQYASYNDALKAYLVSGPIITGPQSKLLIEGERILLNTRPGGNATTFAEIRGEGLIRDSSITSWDNAIGAPDPDPYKPRPYIIIRGGHVDIFNSTISHLGYSLGGLEDTRYAHAALEFYDSHDFTIANSTISFNYYGFYSEDSSNFKITGSEVYGQTRYGLDPHTRSRDFVVDSNYVHDNGNQGIICSLYCSNVTITRNTVEYNVEGIGLHWLTNSSLIQDNTVRFNEKYGIFIQKESFGNLVENNTVIGNRIGIGLLEGSQDNSVKDNIVADNVVDQIHMADDSQNNRVENNRYSPAKAGAGGG